MERYTIFWRGPFSWEQVTNEEGYNDQERLYAITHEPPVRVRRTLYIGRATKQWTGQRLYRHQTDSDIAEDYSESSIVYYLGEVQLAEGQRRTERRTVDIEAAIISNHADILEYNIQSTVFYYGRDLEIKMKGNIPPGLEDFDTSEW